MFFFILQSLFWFLLSLFAGFFLGRWLKSILCKHKARKQRSRRIDDSNTDNTTSEDNTTVFTKTNHTDASTKAGNAYEAAMRKKSMVKEPSEPKASSSFNAKNVATGATTAALATAAYSAHSALKADDKTSSTSIDLKKAHTDIDATKITPTATDININTVDVKPLANEKIITNKNSEPDADVTQIIPPSHTKTSSPEIDNTDQSVEIKHDKVEPDTKATADSESKHTVSSTTAALGTLATAGAINATASATTHTEDKAPDIQPLLSDSDEKTVTTDEATEDHDHTIRYTTTRALEEAESEDTTTLNINTNTDTKIETETVTPPKNEESPADHSVTTLINDAPENQDTDDNNSDSHLNNDTSTSQTKIDLSTADSDVNNSNITVNESDTSPVKEETSISTTTATLGTLAAAGAISAAASSTTSTDNKAAPEPEEKETKETADIQPLLSDDEDNDNTVLYKTTRTLAEADSQDTLTPNTDTAPSPTKSSIAETADEIEPPKNKESSADHSATTLISDNDKNNDTEMSDTKIEVSTTTATPIANENNDSDTNADKSNTTLGIATGIAGAAGIIAATTPTKKEEDEDTTTITEKEPIDTTDFDNLQVIEGIGDTMENILYNNNIGTWKKLSLQSNSNLRALLDQEGDKYKGVQTEGWIEQALLAASGKFTELVRLQKTDGQSKIERKFSYLLGKRTTSNHDKDDLKMVIGIGPKVMELLNNAGIYTFQELTHTSIEHLQKILDDGGPNFRITNPKTWPEQAALADQQEWEKLQQYKGHLN